MQLCMEDHDVVVRQCNLGSSLARLFIGYKASLEGPISKEMVHLVVLSELQCYVQALVYVEQG